VRWASERLSESSLRFGLARTTTQVISMRHRGSVAEVPRLRHIAGAQSRVGAGGAGDVNYTI